MAQWSHGRFVPHPMTRAVAISSVGPNTRLSSEPATQQGATCISVSPFCIFPSSSQKIAPVMRIRKHARGEASAANPEENAVDLVVGRGGQENEGEGEGEGEEGGGTVGSGSTVKENVEKGGEGTSEKIGSRQEGGGGGGGGSGSRSSSFTWLDKLRHAKGFSVAEPSVKLDEFMNVLARKDSLCSGEVQSQFESIAAAESSLNPRVASDIETFVSGEVAEKKEKKSAVVVELVDIAVARPAKLMRDNSIASQMSFKPGALQRCASLVVGSGHDSSLTGPWVIGDARNDNRLRSDASLKKPKSVRSVERGKNIVEEVQDTEALKSTRFGKEVSDPFGIESSDACEDEAKIDALGYYLKHKRKQEKPRLCQKSSDSSERGTESSWMLEEDSQRSDSCSQELQRVKAHYKSGKKKTSGTASAQQNHDECNVLGKGKDLQRSQDSHSSSPTAIFEAKGKGHCNPASCKSSDDSPVNLKLKVARPTNVKSSASQSLHRRSSRNRRVTSSAEHAPAVEVPAASRAPDHPANQRRESLGFSIYSVFCQAGKSGLTAREAVSKILEQGLFGLQEGGVSSRRLVARVLRSSPYFMELEEGKFALFSAIIDAEDIAEHDGSDHAPTEATSEQIAARATRIEAAKQARLEGTLHYWAALDFAKHAHGHTDPGAGQRVRPTIKDEEDESCKVAYRIGEEETTHIAREVVKIERHHDHVKGASQSGRPKRLKYMKQENVSELGSQCNRTDGKGWVCPLLAKTGYQLCDHHLDKLRCKPGSRSKKKKPSKPSKPSAILEESSPSNDELTHLELPVRRKHRTNRTALPTEEIN